MIRLLFVLALVLARLASAQVSTSQFCFPACTGGEVVALSGSADQLRCAEFPSPFSITGATKITIGITNGVALAQCGAGIYSATGSIIAGANAACTAAGPVTMTVSSFNLTAATSYRACWCASSTSVQGWSIEEFATAGMGMVNILNTGATSVGTAANACTVGALPATTGSISAATFKPLQFIID